MDVYNFHEEYLAGQAEKKVRKLVEDTLPKPKSKILHEHVPTPSYQPLKTEFNRYTDHRYDHLCQSAIYILREEFYDSRAQFYLDSHTTRLPLGPWALRPTLKPLWPFKFPFISKQNLILSAIPSKIRPNSALADIFSIDFEELHRDERFEDDHVFEYLDFNIGSSINLRNLTFAAKAKLHYVDPFGAYEGEKYLDLLDFNFGGEYRYNENFIGACRTTAYMDGLNLLLWKRYWSGALELCGDLEIPFSSGRSPLYSVGGKLNVAGGLFLQGAFKKAVANGHDLFLKMDMKLLQSLTLSFGFIGSIRSGAGFKVEKPCLRLEIQL